MMLESAYAIKISGVPIIARMVISAVHREVQQASVVRKHIPYVLMINIVVLVIARRFVTINHAVNQIRIAVMMEIAVKTKSRAAETNSAVQWEIRAVLQEKRNHVVTITQKRVVMEGMVALNLVLHPLMLLVASPSQLRYLTTALNKNHFCRT